MTVEYVYPSQTPRLDACRTGGPDCAKPLFSAEAFSFKDLVDAVNPLQQLPVIGSIYRAETGDTISTFSQLAGGALLGGPIGFMVAALSAGFEAATGNDIGGHLFAAITGSDTQRQYAASAYQKTQNLG